MNRSIYFILSLLVLSVFSSAVIAEVETYTFPLDGMQANQGQGNETEATGMCYVRYDSDSGMLKIWGVHDVESPTAAHIHAAPAGENGGVVFGFSSGNSPIMETWEIDQENLQALRDGNLYVNVHSEQFGGGEIRGQIVQSASDMSMPVSFSFPIQPWQAGIEDAANEVVLGQFRIELGAGHDVIYISGEHSVEDASAMHIHRAPFGEDGGVVFPLTTDLEQEAAWFPSEENVTDLMAGNLYVNIHNPDNPSGVARGQIIQSMYDFYSVYTFTFMADGMQANGGQGNETEATGKFFVGLNEGMNVLSVYGVHDVENPTAAHIHMAPAGENGGVVFPFSSGASPIRERWLLTPEDVENLMAGNFYVNIHSEEFGSGEIRGQIVPTALDSMEWMLVQVSMDPQQANGGQGVESFAYGMGFVRVNADASVIHVVGSHTAAFPTMAHVHRGARDENGGVIFPLHVNLSALDGVWFPGENEAADLLYNNSYINVHTTEFGGGEVRGVIMFPEESADEDVTVTVPSNLELTAAYPNPFNSTARLTVSLRQAGVVQLAVYDLAGREVSRLVDGQLTIGSHEFVWNAAGLSTGTYIAKATADGNSRAVKLVLVK